MDGYLALRRDDRGYVLLLEHSGTISTTESTLLIQQYLQLLFALWASSRVLCLLFSELIVRFWG